jgi:tetratricopeptide (TPR) repeat protein
MRPTAWVLTIVLVGCGIGEQSPDATDAGLFAPALELYSQVRLEEALPLFVQAFEAEPDNPDAHAWVAETARRLWEFDLVVSEAQAALALDPCHSFTHTVLGDAHRTELSSWEGANADSSWAHYQQAVECNPRDGNPWIGIWTAAMERGDRAMEERALRELVETEFLTPSVLAFNRWVLQSLPEDAILITNGDWDTYPALALQIVDGVRTDVGITNRSLLNLLSYANLMSERHGIDLPATQDELENYQPRRNADGSPVILSDHIILKWMELESLSGRPVVFAPTVDMTTFQDNLRLQYAGAHWRLASEADAPDIDVESIRSAMDAIAGSDLSTPEVSPQDRSAVRRSAARNRSLTKVVLHTASQYVAAMGSGDREQAGNAVAWAEQLVSDAGLEAELAEMLDGLRAAVQGGS